MTTTDGWTDVAEATSYVPSELSDPADPFVAGSRSNPPSLYRYVYFILFLILANIIFFRVLIGAIFITFNRAKVGSAGGRVGAVSYRMNPFFPLTFETRCN